MRSTHTSTLVSPVVLRKWTHLAKRSASSAPVNGATIRTMLCVFFYELLLVCCCCLERE